MPIKTTFIYAGVKHKNRLKSAKIHYALRLSFTALLNALEPVSYDAWRD